MNRENPVVVKPELIHLQGIRILKAHFEVGSDRVENPIDVDRFDVGLKSESGFNLDKNYLRFRLYVKVRGTDSDGKTIGVSGEYILEFSYTIDNLLEFVVREKDSPNFNVASILGATIAGISYSTSRGIILERTQVTDFDGVILPVVNPNILLGEDSYSEMV